MNDHQRVQRKKQTNQSATHPAAPDRSLPGTQASPTFEAHRTTDPAAILQLQRTIGNTATYEHLTSIQRETAPALQAAPTWKPPLEFSDLKINAHTKGEAAQAVLLMVDRMRKVRTRLTQLESPYHIDELTSSINSGTQVIQGIGAAFNGEGALTTDDVNQLTIFSSFAAPAYDSGLYTVRSTLALNLANAERAIDHTQLKIAEKQLAEKLHDAYNNGMNDTAVSQLRDGLTKVSEYKSKVDNYIKWTKRATDLLQYTTASELLEDVGKLSGTLGEGMGKVAQVLDAADSLQTLFGSQRTSDTNDSIARFRAFYSLMDIGMGFVKGVPLLGQLWSSYYSPMIKAILNNLEVLFNIRDEKMRELSLLDFKRQMHSAKVTPTIPESLMEHFPGGQPVLNFMYGVMNNGDQKVTPEVEQYFVQNISRFNAGIKDELNQLETESTATANPMTWFGSEKKAPYLVEWVKKNKKVVWAQLYGSLPSDLR